MTLPTDRGCLLAIYRSPRPKRVENGKASAAQESRAPSASAWFGGGGKMRLEPEPGQDLNCISSGNRLNKRTRNGTGRFNF